MTPQAIAARTSFPLDLLQRGIKFLEAPDPYSRTPGEDGKRIVLLDGHRPWGWRIVNHGKYMRLRNMQQKREADRARIAGKRKQNKHVASASQMSPSVANVAHSDSDSNTDLKTLASSPSGSSAAASRNVKALCYIPLNDGTEFGVSAEYAEELSKLYPAVDVPQTLNEIRAWNISNPTQRKTKGGVLRHINSWCAKEQNRGPQK